MQRSHVTLPGSTGCPWRSWDSSPVWLQILCTFSAKSHYLSQDICFLLLLQSLREGTAKALLQQKPLPLNGGNLRILTSSYCREDLMTSNTGEHTVST